MHIYSFEKLEVWQLAREFRKEVYIITKGFPSDEKFGLTSQLRRSASSIGDNLAESSEDITNEGQSTLHQYSIRQRNGNPESYNRLSGSLLHSRS